MVGEPTSRPFGNLKASLESILGQQLSFMYRG